MNKFSEFQNQLKELTLEELHVEREKYEAVLANMQSDVNSILKLALIKNAISKKEAKDQTNNG